MADTGENAAEMQQHLNMFHGFTTVMKWSALGVALIVAFVVFLIAG